MVKKIWNPNWHSHPKSHKQTWWSTGDDGRETDWPIVHLTAPVSPAMAPGLSESELGTVFSMSLSLRKWAPNAKSLHSSSPPYNWPILPTLTLSHVLLHLTPTSSCSPHLHSFTILPLFSLTLSFLLLYLSPSRPTSSYPCPSEYCPNVTTVLLRWSLAIPVLLGHSLRLCPSNVQYSLFAPMTNKEEKEQKRTGRVKMKKVPNIVARKDKIVKLGEGRIKSGRGERERLKQRQTMINGRWGMGDWGR